MPKNRRPKFPPPMILYQDEAIILVDKPPGMLTHPNQYDRKTPSLVNSLSGRLHARVFPVHRLDRDTGGVILFTTDKDRARRLAAAMADGESDAGTPAAGPIQLPVAPGSGGFRKEYLALCAGTMAEEALVTAPVRQGGNGEKQQAASVIRGLANFSVDGMELCLLSVELITGRTHQARIHCETIAKPIIGDRQHGWKPVNARFASLPSVEAMVRAHGEAAAAEEAELVARFAATVEAEAETAEPPGDSRPRRLRLPAPEQALPPMFLRSWKLEFTHPDSGDRVRSCAGLSPSWRRALALADGIPAGLLEELLAGSSVTIELQ
jgi:23S rRNA-/tRNA-specific pseudouridylate synthase